jgi:hypothetical protein
MSVGSIPSQLSGLETFCNAARISGSLNTLEVVVRNAQVYNRAPNICLIMAKASVPISTPAIFSCPSMTR